MYYLRNFLALGLILCLIPLLIFSPINLQPYERYIWIGILFLWFIQRHQINDQCLIILSASFLTFLFLSCQIWEISRRIIIGLILIIGILLMIIICSLDYPSLKTPNQIKNRSSYKKRFFYIYSKNYSFVKSMIGNFSFETVKVDFNL